MDAHQKSRAKALQIIRRKNRQGWSDVEMWILLFLAEGNRPTLSELAKEGEMPVSSVHYALQILLTRELVRPTDDTPHRTYTITRPGQDVLVSLLSG